MIDRVAEVRGNGKSRPEARRMLRFSEGENTPLEYSPAIPALRQLQRLSSGTSPDRQARLISQYPGKAPFCASSIQKKPRSTNSSEVQKRTTTPAAATVRAASRANEPAGGAAV